jgi:hypothetical protein
MASCYKLFIPQFSELSNLTLRVQLFNRLTWKTTQDYNRFLVDVTKNPTYFTPPPNTEIANTELVLQNDNLVLEVFYISFTYISTCPNSTSLLKLIEINMLILSEIISTWLKYLILNWRMVLYHFNLKCQIRYELSEFLVKNQYTN